jgi:hypothetical protein
MRTCPAKAKSAIVSPKITDAHVLACPTSKRADSSFGNSNHGPWDALELLFWSVTSTTAMSTQSLILLLGLFHHWPCSWLRRSGPPISCIDLIQLHGSTCLVELFIFIKIRIIIVITVRIYNINISAAVFQF